MAEVDGMEYFSIEILNDCQLDRRGLKGEGMYLRDALISEASRSSRWNLGGMKWIDATYSRSI